VLLRDGKVVVGTQHLGLYWLPAHPHSAHLDSLYNTGLSTLNWATRIVTGKLWQV